MDGNKSIEFWKESINKCLNKILPDMERYISIWAGDKQEEQVYSDKECIKEKIVESLYDTYLESQYFGEKRNLYLKIYSKKEYINNIYLNPIYDKFFSVFLEKIAKNFKDWRDLYLLEKNEVRRNLLLKDVSNVEELLHGFTKKILNDNGLPASHLLIQLSAQRYEGSPAIGRIYFVSNNKKNEIIKNKMEFLTLEYLGEEQRLWDAKNIRGLRKLLQLSTEDTCLVSIKESGNNKPVISGLASIQILEQMEDLVCLDITGYLQWSIVKQKKTWIRYKNGVYEIGDEDKCHYIRKLDSLNLQNKENIIKIIDCLKNEKHGTSVVFLPKELAWKEAKRLCGFNSGIFLGYENEGINLYEYLKNYNMKGLSAIDGAIIADMDGMCYAIGVILDGEIEKEGKVSRGARYNSVTNYVYIKYKKSKAEIPIFGVVISEDKTVDIYIGNEKTE